MSLRILLVFSLFAGFLHACEHSSRHTVIAESPSNTLMPLTPSDFIDEERTHPAPARNNNPKIVATSTSIRTDAPSTTSDAIKHPYDIFFAFDSARLTEDAQATLDRLSRDLQESHRHDRFRIEGHADARGTEEYNLVLGYRRAYAAKLYLADLGVQNNLMDIETLGEHRPFCPIELAKDIEICHAENRRAHFVFQANHSDKL